MIRTQIYLTARQREQLRTVARRTGQKQSQIIQAAIDAFLDRPAVENRAERLRRFRGMWRGRAATAFSAAREEINRRLGRGWNTR